MNVKYSLVYLIVFIFYYVLASFFSEKKNIAVNLVLLFFISVSVFAIIQTQGHTIYLVFPFACGALLYYGKLLKVPQFKLEVKVLLFWTLFGLVLGLLQHALHSRFFALHDIGFYHNDYAFYANLTNTLQKTGVETMYYQHVFPAESKYAMYHYFEFWANGLFGNIFGFNYYHSYMLILSPLLLLFSIMLITDTCRHLYSSISMWKMVLIITLLTSFCGFRWCFMDEIDFLARPSMFFTSVWNAPKLLVLFLCFSLVINRFLQEKYEEVLVCSVFVLLVYSTVLFSMLSFLMLFLIFIWYQKIKISLPFYFISGFVFLYFIIFYYVLHESISMVSIKEVLQNWTLKDIKVQFNIVVGSSIHLLVFYFPFFILLVTAIFKMEFKMKAFLILFILPVFIGLLAWAFFHKYIDTVQLFSNYLTPILTIIFIFLVFYVYDKGLRGFAYIVGIYAFCCGWYYIVMNYKSIVEDKQLVSLYQNHMKDGDQLAVIKSHETYKNDVFHMQQHPAYFLHYPQLYFNDLRFTEISTDNLAKLPFNDMMRKALQHLNVNTSDYMIFKQMNPTLNEKECRTLFLKKYNFNFLVAKSDVNVYDYISNEVHLELISTHSNALNFYKIQKFN